MIYITVNKEIKITPKITNKHAFLFLESRKETAVQKDLPTLKRRAFRRERTKFTPFQVYGLEREFRRTPYPGRQQKYELSKKLDINESKIQVRSEESVT